MSWQRFQTTDFILMPDGPHSDVSVCRLCQHHEGDGSPWVMDAVSRTDWWSQGSVSSSLSQGINMSSRQVKGFNDIDESYRNWGALEMQDESLRELASYNVGGKEGAAMAIAEPSIYIGTFSSWYNCFHNCQFYLFTATWSRTRLQQQQQEFVNSHG